MPNSVRLPGTSPDQDAPGVGVIDHTKVVGVTVGEVVAVGSKGVLEGVVVSVALEAAKQPANRIEMRGTMRTNIRFAIDTVPKTQCIIYRC
jgi:hypothetical protein